MTAAPILAHPGQTVTLRDRPRLLGPTEHSKAMSPALKLLAADLFISAANGLSRIDKLRWPTYLSASDRRTVSDAVNALGDPGRVEDYAANRTWGPRVDDVMACLAPMLRAEVGQ